MLERFFEKSIDEIKKIQCNNNNNLFDKVKLLKSFFLFNFDFFFSKDHKSFETRN